MKRATQTVAAVALALFAAIPAVADGVLTQFPRAKDGHPDLSGVWQAMNTAHWNLEQIGRAHV